VYSWSKFKARKKPDKSAAQKPYQQTRITGQSVHFREPPPFPDRFPRANRTQPRLSGLCPRWEEMSRVHVEAEKNTSIVADDKTRKNEITGAYGGNTVTI